MISHLSAHVRGNLVGYLALVLVLGMGSAHAASAIADGSVTTKKLAKNAVTKAKIKNKAVTGAKIRDRSITTADLAVGVLPGAGSVFAVNEGSAGADPAPIPDRDLAETSVTLPGGGTALIEWFAAAAFLNCSAGSARVGLYVDGVPVPGSRQSLSNSGGAVTFQTVVVVPLTKGEHELVVGGDCTTGSPTVSGVSYPSSWSVTVVPD